MSPPKRLGRPPKFVNGRDGRPIHGLSYHKSTGTYYATFTDPRVYFGKDFDAALIEFRAWEARQEKRAITITDPNNFQVVDAVYDSESESEGITIALPPGADFDGDDAFEWIKANYDKLPEHVKQQIDRRKGGTIFFDRQWWGIPEDLFWAWVRKAITDNAFLAAQKTGLPLDRLHEFKPLEPSPTLQSLIDLYADKAKITVDWRRKSKQYWSEFMASVKVKTVRQITQQSIADYHDTILESNQSQTYMKHREL